MAFKPITYRAPNNYDTKQVSDDTAVDPSTWGPSLTVQSMTEDADINVMMKRFGVTGKMPENLRIPTFGDFTQVGDFRSALNAVAEAQENFMLLPADLRAKFQNDPQLFLEFASDERNRTQMQELGLLKTPPTPPAGSGGTPGAPGPNVPGTAPGAPQATASGS